MPVSLKTVLAILILPIYIFALAATVSAGNTPPVTTVVQTPISPNGNDNYYISPVTFDLTATDLESGVKEINYRIDSGSWQKATFSDSLNLVVNPSFETPGSTDTSIQAWYASVQDGLATYSRDTGSWATGFETSSARIVATGGTTHGINNKLDFAVAEPFDNMSASAWVKTLNVTGSAYFNLYSVSQDGTGPVTYVFLGKSTIATGTQNWQQIKKNFVVNDLYTIGVYMDIIIEGTGTLWIDAANISQSVTTASAQVTVSTDSTNHTFEYYSVDKANNIEAHSCPGVNCITFKLDQTPPGNWRNSGAFRATGGAEHELYVFTDVTDVTSGLSTNTDQYQYSVETQTGFGRYTDLIHCNTPWLENTWVDLLTSPTTNGNTTESLVTQKTDFCNSNWKICKVVKFYAEDVAGNVSDKDFCLNGPWIRFRGEGLVRSNQNIDMLSEAEEPNTDSVIEIGGTTIDFFESTRNWQVFNSIAPVNQDYDTLFALAGSTSTLGASLVSANGKYLNTGNFEIKNTTTPNTYDDATFNQVVFIDGNLRISNNVSIDETSTALFIVSGDVEIDKNVTTVGIAIITDGDFYTAYNIGVDEATQTLNLNGLYIANQFFFQRTLQGTNNSKDPSESFVFEPKYLIQQRDTFGEYSISWKSVE